MITSNVAPSSAASPSLTKYNLSTQRCNGNKAGLKPNTIYQKNKVQQVELKELRIDAMRSSWVSILARCSLKAFRFSTIARNGSSI